MSKYNEKYFQSDNSNKNSIEDLLETDEKIIWREKPKKSAFIWSKILYMFPIAFLWIMFDGFIIYILIVNKVFSSNNMLAIILFVFFLIHLTPFWIWLSNVFTATAQHKNIEYAFTSKRIIIRSGIIIDIKSIYYIDIQSVYLRVGLIDKILKVGDIYIRSHYETAVLWDIKSPYLVYNKLQKIINDIKTDMYYPNNIRPKENQGYNTKYNYTSNEK